MTSKEHAQRPDRAAAQVRRAAPSGAEPVLEDRPRLPGFGPTRLSQADVLQLQRTIGNAATTQFLGVVQRNGVAARVKALEDELQPESVKAVRRWAKGAKKKSHETWERILTAVKAEEPYWDTVGEHVMAGEDETPPKGYHSTKRGTQANVRAVGPKSPASAGEGVAYKQWTRNKSDTTVANLKISTFYPNNWPEEEIHAAVLLRTAGAEHQVEAAFGLNKLGDTIFPDVDLTNPPKPTA